MEIKTLREDPHHQQLELCKTRPKYRQGRKLTAVKTYTINNESQHLFVYGVPQINLRTELKNLCSKFGQVISIHGVANYKTEAFTECFHIRYERLQSARIAKRLIDNKSFYGGILHVCYAPEFESVGETRVKLQQRCKDVLTRVGYGGNSQLFRRKRKHEEKRGCSTGFVDEHPEEEDPILQESFCKRVRVIKDKTDSEPIITPDVPLQTNIMQNKLQCSLKLIPALLLKNMNSNLCSKKIRFRNKFA